MGFSKDDLQEFRRAFQRRLAVDGREYLAKAGFDGNADAFEGNVLRHDFSSNSDAPHALQIAVTAARETSWWLDETFASMAATDGPDGPIPGRIVLQSMPRNGHEYFWTRCAAAALAVPQGGNFIQGNVVTTEQLIELRQELAITSQRLDARVSTLERDLLTEPSQDEVTGYLKALGLEHEPHS